MLGDLLCLDYARRDRGATTTFSTDGSHRDHPATLAVRPASVTPRCADNEAEGHPGARRGHTMTATRLGAGAGTPGAVVLGGWGQDDDGLSPTLLSCTADLAPRR